MRHYAGSPKEGWKKTARGAAWRRRDLSCTQDRPEHRGRENWGVVHVGMVDDGVETGGKWPPRFTEQGEVTPGLTRLGLPVPAWHGGHEPWPEEIQAWC